MAKNDLLKEAIADAKAISESALKNAKDLLEQSFTSRMSRIGKIKEQEEFEDDEETYEEEEEMYEEEEVDLEDDAMDGEEEEDLDMEFESILKELEGEDSEEMYEEEDMYEEEELEFEDDDVLVGEEDEYMDDEDDIVEALLREMEDEDDESDDYEDDDNDEEEETVDETIRRRKLSNKNKPNSRRAYKKTLNESAKLRRQLKESYTVIKHMKNKINEVNLLNGKLMYALKIFKTYNLNDAQKIKVLETFDAANSVREAKLVYATISQGLSLSGKRLNEDKKQKFASQKMGSGVKKRGEILSEDFKKRVQMLAGIIENPNR